MMSAFYVILFQSVNHAMKAEKALKEKGIRYKLIPVPKTISSECGVCLRISPDVKTAVIEALEGEVEYRNIVPL